jgi:hypothetical protein
MSVDDAPNGDQTAQLANTATDGVAANDAADNSAAANNAACTANNNNAANGAEPPVAEESSWWRIARMLVIYFIVTQIMQRMLVSTRSSPPQRDGDDNNNGDGAIAQQQAPRKAVRNAWESGEQFNLAVFISTSADARFVSDDERVWQREHVYEWPSVQDALSSDLATLIPAVNVSLAPAQLSALRDDNMTLYAHALFQSPNRRNKRAWFNCSTPLVSFRKPAKVSTARSLLGKKTPVDVADDDDYDVAVSRAVAQVADTTGKYVTYIRPSATVRIVLDHTVCRWCECSCDVPFVLSFCLAPWVVRALL